MSTAKQPIKKMKLEDLQPKAPELTVPEITKVTEDFWKPLKDIINVDMPQVFGRLKEAIAFITSIQTQFDSPETVQSINVQAANIVKDSEPLMQRWNELKTSIDTQTAKPMQPEEALALSFTFQADTQQWLIDANVLIDTPLDNLLDYCTSKLPSNEPTTQVEQEITND